MMMKIAGGPGMVSPIDFGERKKPLPRWMWAAIAVSAMAHGSVGVWLYQQNVALPRVKTPPTAPTTIVTMQRPKPPEPVVSTNPAAPTPPIHKPVSSVPASDPLFVDFSETPVTGQPDVLVTVNPTPVPDATGTAKVEQPPQPPLVITNPNWTRKPTGSELMRAYPDEALRRGIGGTANLRCSVRVGGTLTDCMVISESPPGQGFGQAGLDLTRHFRMSPGMVDRRPVEGARVTIPLRFTPPAD